ncbi:MAG: NAD(P) transhydrogenase subunit alpha [Actinomycetota bacterium]
MSATRTVLVPKERGEETRVALVPTAVRSLIDAGWHVLVEPGAGIAAGFPDEVFVTHGAEMAVADAREQRPDVVVGVRLGGASDDPLALERSLGAGTILIGIADPLGRPEAIGEIARAGLTLYSLDLLPRISRAQSMDVLSSQSTVTGYKAVVLAAAALPKMFPMLTTAAGTVPPAEVLVVGAGVAGLTAIATAKRLGAVVQAYDVRPAAQEDIESVGARAVLLPLQPGDAQDATGYAKDLGEAFEHRQQELLAQVVAGVDVVITTAAIPGRPAPILLTAEAVAEMPYGSVVVDCAAPRGGNCALTRPDEEVVTERGVRIFGPTNLPATVPRDASRMFAKNIVAFLTTMLDDPSAPPNLDDEIVRGTLVTRDGEVVHERIRQIVDAPPMEEATRATPA